MNNHSYLLVLLLLLLQHNPNQTKWNAVVNAQTTDFGNEAADVSTSDAASSSSSSSSSSETPLSFAMVSGASSFFLPVEVGWNNKCGELGIAEGDCYYNTYSWNDYDRRDVHPCPHEVLEYLRMSLNGTITPPLAGISTQCNFQNPDIYTQAHDAGIPIVVFDSPPPEDPEYDGPEPDIYIGTDNEAMGRTMARLTKQLVPNGGTFGTIYCPECLTQIQRNFGYYDEMTKDNNRTDRPHWHAVEFNRTAPKNSPRLYSLYLLAESKPTVMAFMLQSPMRRGGYKDFIDENRDITFIGTDGSGYQLDYLSQRYVDGLVGQMPYDFGAISAQVLHDVATGKMEIPPKPFNFVPTNLVAYNFVPIELPDLVVDENLLGNLKIAGYICFAILAATSLWCLGWTYTYRDQPVLQSAQLYFLSMIAFGIFIMSCVIVPLSFDDEGYGSGDFGDELPEPTMTWRIGVCMSIPWLAFSGFSITFSALFSKTWSVNNLFRKSEAEYGKVQVTTKGIVVPFGLIFIMNVIILICWTVIDPLTYTRRFGLATDYWNRELTSYGSCASENVTGYAVTLMLVNVIPVLVACYHSFQARCINLAFNEATYIGLSVFAFAQAFLTGLPTVAVARKIPEAYYLVLVFLIFSLGMVVLALIFIPKYSMQKAYWNMSDMDQRKMLALSSIRKTPGTTARSFTGETASQRSVTNTSGGTNSYTKANILGFGLPDAAASAPGNGSGSSDGAAAAAAGMVDHQRPLPMLHNNPDIVVSEAPSSFAEIGEIMEEEEDEDEENHDVPQEMPLHPRVSMVMPESSNADSNTTTKDASTPSAGPTFSSKFDSQESCSQVVDA